MLIANNKVVELPKLYKKTNTGAIQYWQVRVWWVSRGGEIETEYGQVGTDNPQVTYDIVESGKNIGKKNETSPIQQAALQAKQQFDKKIKQGYVESLELAQVTDNALDGVKPMLAHVFEDHVKKVVFPAYTQPKLDGLRCLARVDTEGRVSLFTRTQKPILTVPHVVKALQDLASKLPQGREFVFDGELYNHEFKEDFNKIISLIKRDELHPEHEKIQYHIYDIAIDGRNFEARQDLLRTVFNFNNTNTLQLVTTDEVENKDELDQKLGEYLEQGYEGAMYRNPNSHYEGKRSHGLLKVKTFRDDEFEIVDVEEGNGKLMGKAGAIWCLTKKGKRFKAKMRGALDGLTDIFVNKQNYIGKLLTVKYQNYTPDEIPRFPVGMRIRTEE